MQQAPDCRRSRAPGSVNDNPVLPVRCSYQPDAEQNGDGREDNRMRVTRAGNGEERSDRLTIRGSGPPLGPAAPPNRVFRGEGGLRRRQTRSRVLPRPIILAVLSLQTGTSGRQGNTLNRPSGAAGEG